MKLHFNLHFIEQQIKEQSLFLLLFLLTDGENTVESWKLACVFLKEISTVRIWVT